MKLNKIATLSIAAIVPLAFAGCSQETADSVASDAASNAEVVESAAGKATSAAADAADGAASKASDAASESDDSADDASPSSDASNSAASNQAGSADDAAKARELALKHIEAEAGSEGVVIAQDLEDRSGKWDVDVLLGENLHEVKINTADDSAKTEEAEAADDEDGAAAASEMTIDKAIEAALADTPGIVENAAWDDDDSSGWEIEIVPEGQNDEIDVKVDPVTGKVSKAQ